MHQGDDDGCRKNGLRCDHGGRREQKARKAERSGTRQDEIDREPDDDRGRPSSALASTMTTCRPLNSLTARAPPNGAPITMEIRVADRLTRSDSATIPTSSGSKLPSRLTAAMRAWTKSCIPAYVTPLASDRREPRRAGGEYSGRRPIAIPARS